jgi:hypothetical protein
MISDWTSKGQPLIYLPQPLSGLKRVCFAKEKRKNWIFRRSVRVEMVPILVLRLVLSSLLTASA